ncbi:MAG: PilZ domain-containing protein [Pseudomonadota bacterium]
MEVLAIAERRVKPRVETKIRVRIGGFEGESETFTGNLSKSGIFLETKEPFAKIGEKLQMQIEIPHSGETIRVTAKVARIVAPNRLTETPGMGFHFLKIEARQARLFDKFIDQLLDARGIGSRRYPRARTQLVIEIRSKAMARKVITDNLSYGGLFLKTSIEGFALGDRLAIVLVHPTSKRKFAADVEVVHLRKGESGIRKDFMEGIGVQFIDLTPARREDMAIFLKSILASQRRGKD